MTKKVQEQIQGLEREVERLRRRAKMLELSTDKLDGTAQERLELIQLCAKQGVHEAKQYLENLWGEGAILEVTNHEE